KPSANTASCPNSQPTSVKKPWTQLPFTYPIWQLKNGPAAHMLPATIWADSAAGGIYKTNQPAPSTTRAQTSPPKATNTSTARYARAKTQPKPSWNMQKSPPSRPINRTSRHPFRHPGTFDTVPTTPRILEQTVTTSP